MVILIKRGLSTVLLSIALMVVVSSLLITEVICKVAFVFLLHEKSLRVFLFLTLLANVSTALFTSGLSEQ